VSEPRREPGARRSDAFAAEHFFAPCPRGLEAPLATEMESLGARDVSATDGGVAFAGPRELAYRAILVSRIASRVLWRVAHGGYRDENDLYALVQRVDWPGLFESRRTLRVDVAATRSPLASLEFATLRVKDGVCDRFRAAAGVRPSVDKRRPDVRVHAFLAEREATLYLDTSGEALFKRGYRRDVDGAPMRENLAAGIVALSGWTPATTLLDPMCGSGTIAIEAAMVAADRAPGLARTFGFQKLAWFDGPAWQRIRQRARDRVRADPARVEIVASDVDERALDQARASAARAGVDGWIRFEKADVLARDAPAPSGVWIANPPYGVRLENDASLAAFYPRLGDALKRRFAGWDACVFTGDLRLPKLIGLKPTQRTPLWNGAIECRLYRFPLVSGRPPR
jgi:putative N6-adenine-specific DNA methylase